MTGHLYYEETGRIYHSAIALRCLLCGNWKLDRVGYNRSFGVDIHRCIECGLIQSDYVSDSALRDYYARYYRGVLSETEIDRLKVKSREQAISQVAYLDEMIPGFQFKAILEIGASDGQTAIKLKQHAERVYVTEADQQYVDLLNSDPELTLIRDKDLEEDQYKGSFDLIVLSHVIEHLPDPLSALYRFSRLLRRNGYLFMDLPNESELLLSTDFQAKGHLTYFSPETFQRLIDVNGEFDILNLRTCNHSVEDLVASNFTLEEEYFRRETKNGTVIRTLLKRSGKEASESLPVKSIDPLATLEDYSRRMMIMQQHMAATERRFKAEQKRNAALLSEQNDLKNGVSEVSSDSSNPGPSGTKAHDRMAFDFSLVGKGSFFLDLDLSQYSHRMIQEETDEIGCYEKDLSTIMGALLKRGDMVIDVGAHIGYVSLLAAIMVGTEGSVSAFEPVEENADHLRHNLQINNIRHVGVNQAVVGDRVGDTPFYYNQDNDGGHALWDVGTHPFNTKSRRTPCCLSLPMTTLDHHFARTDLSRLKMIKIDTEGNEVNVLNGARRILKHRRIPCVVCELNKYGLKQTGHTEDDLRDIMSALGYERFIFLNDKLTRLSHDQYIRSDHIINLFFMPREFVTGAP